MTAAAVITVRLDINVNDTWGDDCAVSQIKKQAKESAWALLNKALENDPKIKISGEVECTSVKIFEEGGKW